MVSRPELTSVALAQDDTPYAGLETREIKALSPEEVEELLAGEGLGYALAAELNRYPGPREIARLEGEFRAAHLVAHLETRDVLTEGQVATYLRLRGYSGEHADPAHRHVE